MYIVIDAVSKYSETTALKILQFSSVTFGVTPSSSNSIVFQSILDSLASLSI